MRAVVTAHVSERTSRWLPLATCAAHVTAAAATEDQTRHSAQSGMLSLMTPRQPRPKVTVEDGANGGRDGETVREDEKGERWGEREREKEKERGMKEGREGNEKNKVRLIDVIEKQWIVMMHL